MVAFTILGEPKEHVLEMSGMRRLRTEFLDSAATNEFATSDDANAVGQLLNNIQ